MQEVKKSHNHHLRADPMWSIKFGKIESNPGDFPGLRWLPQVLEPSKGRTTRCWRAL